MNLIEIGLVVFKIWEVEICKILVHVNNTCVLRATFLAARQMTVCLNITMYADNQSLSVFACICMSVASVEMLHTLFL